MAYCILLPRLYNKLITNFFNRIFNLNNARFKFNLPMTANALNRIYHDHKYFAFFGKVERHLMRAKQIDVPRVTLHA